MESVKLKDGRYIDTDGVYDFKQKKTQKEINSKLIEKEVLWTNPKPDEAFTSQSITLERQKYKYLIFTFKGYRSQPNVEDFIIQTSSKFSYSSVMWSEFQDVKRIWHRSFTSYNENANSIAFRNATEQDLERGTIETDNNRLIPLKIYGTDSL